MSGKSKALRDAAAIMAVHARVQFVGAKIDIVMMPLADAEALGAVLTDEDRARGYWTNEGKR